MDLYLIRHPRPAIDPGICYGQSDLKLREPVNELIEPIRSSLPADYILFSSPLQRCVRLAQALGRDIRPDPRLMELHFGRWELQNWDSIGAQALDSWQAHDFGAEAHGGESYAEFRARVLDWLHEQNAVSLPVVAVTHAGVIRALLREIKGWSLQDSLAYPVPYGGVEFLSLPEGFESRARAERD